MKTNINLRNIFEAFIIILIIVDLVLLMLITFTNVSHSLLHYNNLFRFNGLYHIIL